MNKICMLLVVALSAVTNSAAFAPVARTTPVSRTVVFSEDKSSSTVERGVSVDQDGKSNVWAIEPKMEVSTKSSEETTQTALIAGGGIAAFVVLAGLALSNLPDPNQF